MEELRSILPGWETVRCIGSGSSGRVYELKKKDEYGGDYSSALKVITIPSSQKEYDEMKNTMSEFAMRAKLRDKVEEISNEYRLMGVLRGHPNIVNCEDQMILPHTDDLGWDICIRMELLTSLPEYVEKNGMPVSEIVKLGIDICSALELCRDNGIIHRDIKPQNIFVSRYAGYKLGDFSVAMMKNIKSSPDMAGTYSYMAPEVYKGKAYDDRVDIYSLGMVLYCLLNEQRGPFLPYDAVPEKTEIAQAQLRRFGGEELPPPKFGSPTLKKIVLKACAFDKENRFKSPSEMKRALMNVLNKRSVPVEQMYDPEATVREAAPVQRDMKASPVAHTPPAEPKKEHVTQTPKKPEPSEDTKSKNNATTAIIILATIAALLALAIMIIIVFGDDRGGRSEPTVTKTPTVTVEPTKEIRISALVVSSPRLIMTEGESATLTVSCIPEVTDGAQKPRLLWKSSDSSIATVDETGNVTGLKEGTATVVVYLENDMEVFDECMVIVEKPVAAKLEITQLPTKTVYTLNEPLDTEGLVLKVTYNNGEEKEITDPAEYTVTCNMEGLGSRTATVFYENLTAQYTVRVSLFG